MKKNQKNSIVILPMVMRFMVPMIVGLVAFLAVLLVLKGLP